MYPDKTANSLHLGMILIAVTHVLESSSRNFCKFLEHVSCFRDFFHKFFFLMPEACPEENDISGTRNLYELALNC